MHPFTVHYPCSWVRGPICLDQVPPFIAPLFVGADRSCGAAGYHQPLQRGQQGSRGVALQQINSSSSEGELY